MHQCQIGCRTVVRGPCLSENVLRLFVTFAALFYLLGPAFASEATFISASTGNNANPCSRNSPCRTINGALNKTDPGGEIKMLDPGDYGLAVITKAVSIVSESPGEAAIQVAFGSTGVTVNAGAGDVITLRGLTIKGVGTGGAGIIFNSGAALLVDSCVIRNLSSTGIHFHATGTSSLTVANTLIYNVGFRGIHVNPPGGSAASMEAVVYRSGVHNTGDVGIFAQGTGATGTINMTVSDTVSSGNAADGIRANSLGGATTTLSVVRSTSSNNNVGISGANSDAIVRVADSMITGNNSGWTVSNGAVLQSYGNNFVNGNGANEGAMPLIGTK
jgi:hypothetical protein